MTADSPMAVLDRLRAVVWQDFDNAFDHSHSRVLLMWEYLRRTALWAKSYGFTDSWPFTDIAEHVAPGFQVDQQIQESLDEFIESSPVGLFAVRPCRAAVRWAALSQSAQIVLPDLPDPYEPLLIMFERGGGYSVEEFIDLDGASIPVGTVEIQARRKPFLITSTTTLDAYDILYASGNNPICYLLPGSDEQNATDLPAELVIRRIDRASSATVDEKLSPSIDWAPTSLLRDIEAEGEELRRYEVDKEYAISYIEHLIEKVPYKDRS